MKLKKLPVLLAVAFIGSTHLTGAYALGLGEIKARSGIGQPLVAEIEVLANDREAGSLKIAPASFNDYESHRLQYSPALTGAQIKLQRRDNKLVAVVTTSSPVMEPYINLMVDGESSGGRVRRAYSLLLQPPVASAPAPVSRFASDGPVVEVHGRAAAPAPVRLALYTNIIERGISPSRLPTLEAGGRNQPITQALYRVVPKGWKGFAGDPGVKMVGNVSWTGGRNWLETLDGLLSDVYLTAVVDWEKREITFSSMEAASVQATVVEPAPVPVAVKTSMTQTSPAVPNPVAARDSRTDVMAIQLDEVRGELRRVMAELQGVKHNSSASAAQVQAQQTQIVSTQKERDDALARARDSEARAEEASAKLHKAQDDISQLESEVARLTLSYKDANERAEKAKVELEAARAELSQVRTDQAATTSAFSEQLVKLQRELAEERNGHEATRARMAEIARSYDEAQARLVARAAGPSKAIASSYKAIRLLGAMPDEGKVASIGLNVAFPNALQQIVPQGWMIMSKLPTAPLVSWRGANRAWLQVLDDMLAANGLTATVDVPRMEVTITR